jgi:V/A-type H+-transporting ATPase subunit A
MDRVVLEGARVIREDFLQQNAYHEIDTFCPDGKQYRMLQIMLGFYDLMTEAIKKGIGFDHLQDLKIREVIARMATIPNEKWEKRFNEIEKEMEKEITSLEA